MSQKPSGAQPANPSVGPGLRTDVLPDLTRPDVGLVLMARATVASPEQQDTALDGITGAWAATPLPAAFLSRVSYASTDGRTVFGYGQWTSAEEYDAFRDAGGSGLGERLAAVEHVSFDGGPSRYRLYRSSHGAPHPEGEGVERPSPGCVVVVTFETPGEAEARQLVDGVFEAAEGLAPNPGGLSAHFHISEDGTRVVNYAEWTDEEAHQRALDRNVQPGGAVRAAIDGVPGVRPLGFERFVKYRGVVRR